MEINGSFDGKQIILDIPCEDGVFSVSHDFEEEESVPVSLILEEEESVPVSLVLEEEESVPVHITLDEGEELVVSLSDNSVSAIGKAVALSIPPQQEIKPADISFLNTCAAVCAVGVFACLGALCVRALLSRLNA